MPNYNPENYPADFGGKLALILPAVDLAEKVYLITKHLDAEEFKSPVELGREAKSYGDSRLKDPTRCYRDYLKKSLSPFVEKEGGSYRLNKDGIDELLPIANHFEAIASSRERKGVTLDFLCSLFYRTKYPTFLFGLMDWVYGNNGKEKRKMPRNGVPERTLYYFIDEYGDRNHGLKLFGVNKDFLAKFSTYPYTEFRRTQAGKYLYKNFFLPIKQHLSLPKSSKKRKGLLKTIKKS